jgi:hypothetical protein
LKIKHICAYGAASWPSKPLRTLHRFPREPLME